MASHSLYLWANHFRARYGKYLPALIFITEHTRVDAEHVIPHLPPHSLVIIRDYDIAEREAYVKHIIMLARRHHVKTMVAGSPALARKYKADGVHFPGHLRRQAIVWKKQCPHWLISTSVHSLRAARHLKSVDFALLSPVFKTPTHPKAKPLGIAQARMIAHNTAVPLYPLGGILPNNVILFKTLSIPGIAAISGCVPPLLR